MKIIICGATGFIGRNLTGYFLSLGYAVESLCRDDFWDNDEEFLQTKIEGADVVINVAGANIGKRWSKSYKKELYNSRVGVTRALVDSINSMDKPPKIFISASAIGYYESGVCGDEISGKMDDSFLANLCYSWEREVQNLNKKVRYVIMRMGLVIAHDGGAFEKMMKISNKFGVAFQFGDGRQRVSWISITDLCRLYDFVINNSNINGIVNCVTPGIITNRTLTKLLTKKCKSIRLSVPSILLRFVLGDAAQVLLNDMCVYSKIGELDFRFDYPYLEKYIEEFYYSDLSTF